MWLIITYTKRRKLNMTLALIVLVVFLIVRFFDSAKKKEEKQAQRKQTITNVKRQDELWCDNYKKVINDLKDMEQPSCRKLKCCL